MELYYHKTDGGAEYYCAEYVGCENGHKEGLVETALLRTDGREIEVFMENCQRYGMKLVCNR